MNITKLCTILDWDTTFFGLRVARLCQDTVTIDETSLVDAWCFENRVDCLYFLARSDQPSTSRVAEMRGFNLTDIRVTYSCDLVSRSSSEWLHFKTSVRPSKPVDLSVLQMIARHSHTDSRFYADERFPRHLCDALYETWIVRSCTGYADVVLIAESEEVPVGYISCHLDKESRHGSIGLVGVDSQWRGQGIAQALVGKALEWFRAHEMQTVAVVTQGRNIAAQRLYQKNGFLISAVQLWYHKWYEAESRTL